MLHDSYLKKNSVVFGISRMGMFVKIVNKTLLTVLRFSLRVISHRGEWLSLLCVVTY